MRLKIFYVSLFLCFLLLRFCTSSICQPNESQIKYDEIIQLKPQQQTEQESSPTPQIEKDELALLLPKLNNSLYIGWATTSEPKISKQEGDDFFVELGLEKVLKQTYQKESHYVDVSIYKFSSFASAYSTFTVLHGGDTSKLKVGKNTTESDRLVNFWKGNYFVDIHTQAENDKVAKEFIVLSSQDISNNIQADQMPPVVAIQLPALDRIGGSEKYCLGVICCKKFLLGKSSDFNPEIFNLGESGGLITADYQLSENPKDKEKITLVLVRYTKIEASYNAFISLKEKYENKQKENKEIGVDIDITDGTIKVKNKKNDYTMLKQKGNLLAVAYGITNKKSGEQVLSLVPWPVEIKK